MVPNLVIALLPTGRFTVGGDAAAQGKQPGFIIFSGGQSGRPNLGRSA